MMKADRINAVFEAGGAAILLLNVWRLVRDQLLAGVHWLPTAWFTAWGLWNILYYRHLGQTASWYAGIAVAAVNATWLALAAYYAWRI